ncbi:MAG: hypothetical protein AAF639_02730 [Chloroflexota bacterium]
MANRRIFAHPEYFALLRKAKAQKSINDLGPIVNEVIRVLGESENPLANAKPVEKSPGRWTIEIMSLTFEFEPIPPEGADIRILSVE